ncbi:MAG: phosphoribosyltransferase [Candidatus Omnitrophica bacterium]|nr:phosphoribosyltransferase [Candidatus Omnitrophota bacterium]
MTGLDFSKIVARLRDFAFPEVDLVVGVESGGIVPASLVALRLGRPAAFISINYRDTANRPQHERPVLLKPAASIQASGRVLLVDDVSVTGQTLALAREVIGVQDVSTFVLKGRADHVLFPELTECVEWPWNKLKKG